MGITEQSFIPGFLVTLLHINTTQYIIYPRCGHHVITNEAINNLNLESPLFLSNLTRLSLILKKHRLIKSFEQKILNFKPDIIHAHTLFSDGILAYEIYKKYSIPYQTEITQ